MQQNKACMTQENRKKKKKKKKKNVILHSPEQEQVFAWGTSAHA
jgi:hypothetical protein